MHDLGMCLTIPERQRILSSLDFEEELRRWPQLWDELEATRLLYLSAQPEEKLLIENRLFQLQEAGLAAYLRPRHATSLRYRELIAQLKDAAGRSDLFEVRGVSFENELIEICVSHNLDAGVLLQTTDAYTERFSRDLPIGGQRLNVQFCAAILRLIDILDFDQERTPRVLFESLGIADNDLPGGEVSLQEWNKLMAVHSIDFRPEEMVVSADSTHPAIECSIREFCFIIEREIRDTMSVLRKNPPEVLALYQVELPLSVRAQIRSLGYVYKELAFTLDESSISTLLMGEGLYSEKAVALRELIQNSIDACKVRELIERGSVYKPLVEVRTIEDANGRIWLEVEDNGIGMDEHVLSNYFFRIGKSYYSTPEFERIVHDMASRFAPISRFGIGILSVFMIGDILEVITQNRFSPRGDTLSRNLRVTRRFGLAFVTESPTGNQGTTVRVRLTQRSREDALFFLARAASYIRKSIWRPQVPVKAILPPLEFSLGPSLFLGLHDNAVEKFMEQGIEPIIIDVGRWSERLSGRIILLFFRTDEGKLWHRKQINLTTEIRIKVEDHRMLLKNYTGNRITVNGISMSLKRLGRVLGRNQRIAAAIDVELRGDEDILYDVARNKLVGSGGLIARNELRKVIIEGIKGLWVYEQLHEQTKAIIDQWFTEDGRPIKGIVFKPVKDDMVLSAIIDVMPREKWPIGIHRIVAEKLNIPAGLAHRAISTLLEDGRLKKPE